MDKKEKKRQYHRELLFSFIEQELEQDELETLQSMLNRFPNINTILESNGSGNTLLHIAVMNRNLPVVKILVDRGANVNAENDDLDTPLNIAYRQGPEWNEILNLLKVKDFKIKPSETEPHRNENENLELGAESEEIDYVMVPLLKDESLVKELINVYKKGLRKSFSSFHNWKTFQLLMLFQDKSLLEIYNFRDFILENAIVNSFKYCSNSEADVILGNIEKYIMLKSNCSYCEQLLKSDIEMDNEFNEKHNDECLRKSLVNELFEIKTNYCFGNRNMVRNSSENRDSCVFEKTISFCKRIFGEDYKKLVKEKDYDGRCILFCDSEVKVNNIKNIIDILKCHVELKEIKEFLQSVDNYNIPHFFSLFKYLKNDGGKDFLKYLRKLIDDDNSYKNMLLTESELGCTFLHYLIQEYNMNAFDVVLKEMIGLVNINSEDGKEEIMDWIQKKNFISYNIATRAAIGLDKGILTECFDKMRKSINDDQIFTTVLFEGVFLCHDLVDTMYKEYNNCALIAFDFMLSVFRKNNSSIIPDDCSFLNELLKGKCRRLDCSFISLAVKGLDSKKFSILIEKLRKSRILSEDEMREFFLETDEQENNILHKACENSHDDDNVISVVCEEMVKLFNENKEELISFIMKSDDYGETLLHYLNGETKSFDKINALIEFIGKVKRKELLFKVDYEGNTCLHCLYNYKSVEILKENILLITEWLENDEFEKLILLKNNKGNSFYSDYYLLLKNTKYLEELEEFLSKVLSNDTFERLMKQLKPLNEINSGNLISSEQFSGNAMKN